MAKKEEKTNVMRLLSMAKIPYTAHYYDHSDGEIDGVSVAHKLGQPPEQVFKTLVARSTRQASSCYVFVIPVEKELDLKAAARAAGEKAIEMLHVNELLPTTGYIRGGCSPVGMKKKFPTFFDQSARQQPTIMVSGGKIGCQVEVEPDRLVDYTGGSYQPLTVEEMA